MALNPARYTKVFGSGFVKDYAEHPLLTIGRDVWTRGDLARMGVVQTRACSILSGIARKLKSDSLKDLFDNSSPYTFADHPAGVTTLYVLFAAFLDRGLDPNDWYKAGREAALVSFHALKHRELEARARERADTKRRSRSSRRREHERGVKVILDAARS